MSGAYYNEIDPYAAEWLRNLIKAGHIAAGDVDERSIEDVRPDDIRGYTQCHFFAGIGVWSYALRRAGIPDSQPVWTGSCPCQPFSAAGQGAGFADERHLWPAFDHLIEQCRPPRIYGEQVASKDADPWIDLVSTDLEALGYAFGAVAFPSAGIGAPHIRDRMYWVADADGKQCNRGGASRETRRAKHSDRSATRWMDNANHAGLEGLGRGHQAESGRIATLRPVAAPGESGGLADYNSERFGAAAGASIHDTEHHVESRGGVVGMADAILQQRQNWQPGIGNEHAAPGWIEGAAEAAGFRGDLRPGPTNGYWRDADWLGCRDGKWRPVEPGTFPLANGAASRMGRLRAYGNAINAEAAIEFIRAVA